MRTTAQTGLLLLISGLLGANLVASLSPSPRAFEVLPRASAQEVHPLEADLRTGKTLITASPAGDTLFVWVCKVVNGQPSFEVQRFTSRQ